MTTTRDKVRRFAMEYPRMVHALEFACQVAREHEQWQQFAGTWVIKPLLDEKLQSGEDVFDVPPSLRLFLSSELLVKVGNSTRGGKRAYYWMPDFDEVERAIKELPNRPAVHES